MRADASSAIHFLLASRQCELNNLRYLLQNGERVGSIGLLVHALQCERGASNLYVCSDGAPFVAELDHRQHAVDAARNPVLASLAQLEKQAAALPQSSRLFSQVASVLYPLGLLPSLRRQIRERTVAQAPMTAFFDDIIRHLLALVFELTDSAAEPAVARALLALHAFMQGKEFAGQERAAGAAAFAAGRHDEQICRRLADLIDRQERCFAMFIDFADEENRQKWRAMRVDGQFERMRRLLCTGATAAADQGLCWYTEASRRIDQLKRIEDALAQTVMSCCRQAIRAAEQACQDQQADIETLLRRQDDRQPDYATLLTGGEEECATGDWLCGGAPLQLGRSLLALIRRQDRRLQALDQELAVLRASLDERKKIEQAKGFLMQHRGLSEEAAYHTLRRLAMNQNKKMVDVAAALLTVSEVWHTDS
ncbi:nitrate regulatory protein [Martelella alba]|uniref:ANTAR domain-containing protein n=1 Tax=Martelella alba TaxID=2590451 RepID=A0ABY2SMJ2_9HYPH|nr:nitrate regulatory protein [Martelella alba]TKI06567.1 ANTAR domain-containing protein [Martelella alba]